MRAVIKKYNKPYCPNCDIILGRRLVDYGLGYFGNESYFKFVRLCDKCHREYIYYVDIETYERKDFKNIEEDKVGIQNEI